MLVIKKYRKLKAFTVLELVIGLVITSIVISMVYFIYENISKQVVQYSIQQDELMEYNQFQSLLSKDIKLSKEMIFVDGEHIRLNFFSKDIDYFFDKEYVIRKSAVQDTFNIEVLNLELNDAVLDLNKEEAIINKYQTIRLKTKLLGRELTFFEEKQISLAKQLNNQFFNEH